MREVETSMETDASRGQLLAELSPETIIEHAETFEIESTSPTRNGEIVTVTGGEIEMTLEFRRTEDGYTYEQMDDEGPYEEMRSSISVTEGYEARSEIVARSRFTFGGWFPFITDRWAAKYRKEELERLVSNLVSEVEGTGSSEPGGKTAGEIDGIGDGGHAVDNRGDGTAHGRETHDRE